MRCKRHLAVGWAATMSIVGAANVFAMATAPAEPRFSGGNVRSPVLNASFHAYELGPVPLGNVFRYNGKLVRSRFTTSTFESAFGGSAPHWNRSSPVLLSPHAAGNERPRPTVFQVVSYHTVNDSRTFDAFFFAMSESKTWATMLAGFGIVSLIAWRRIV